MDDYRDYLAVPSRRRSRWPLFFGMALALFIIAAVTPAFLLLRADIADMRAAIEAAIVERK